MKTSAPFAKFCIYATSILFICSGFKIPTQQRIVSKLALVGER